MKNAAATTAPAGYDFGADVIIDVRLTDGSRFAAVTGTADRNGIELFVGEAGFPMHADWSEIRSAVIIGMAD